MNKQSICGTTALLTLITIQATLLTAQDVKRGWAGSSAAQANASNARWVYNWGYQPPAGIHGDYVPMFWSRYGIQTRVDAILGYENVQYVLGFNEPERPDQANMSVAEAIQKWTEICEGLDGSGIKLVSPAVSDTVDGRAWLADFMQQAAANNLVVDEIAFHWYGFVNPANPVSSANSFLNKVDQYHNDYGRNVWVTEFAGLDFADQFTTEQMQQANATFMSVAIPGLESRPYVTRYSMWAHSDDSRPLIQDAYGAWKTTVVGDNYLPTYFSGDTLTLNSEGASTDVAFLRGGEIVANGPTDNALKDIYALSNYDNSLLASSIGGEHDWSLTEHGIITIEENATLRKIDNNAISVRNATVRNDGLMRLFEGGAGIFWIHGPETTTLGSGQFRLDANSKLKLGRSGDTQGFAIAYPIQCRGGEIEVTGNDIRIQGDSTLFLQTRMDIAGSLHVEGNLLRTSTGGGSGLIKQGQGTLFLSGNNTHVGDTIVNDGTLVLNGSLTNDLILNQGIVQGAGQVGGALRVAGTLRPGNNVGAFQADSCEFQSGGILEIDLGPFAAVDRLVVNGPLLIHTDSTLRVALIPGHTPKIGDVYDIVDADVIGGQFGTMELPTLSDGQWDLELFNLFGIIRVVANDVLTGDVNLDGSVNLLDVSPFIQLLTSGTFQPEADINQDGLVNLIDVEPFVQLLGGG